MIRTDNEHYLWINFVIFIWNQNMFQIKIVGVHEIHTLNWYKFLLSEN
jgi:hypothetical protein